MHKRFAATLLFGLAVSAFAAEAQVRSPTPSAGGTEGAVLERAVRAFYVTYFPGMKKDSGALALPLEASLDALERKAAKDDALPFDYFCGCQDYEMKNLAVTAQSVTPQSAVVVAQFENFGRVNRVTYRLTKTSAGWRIQDIVSPEGHSLRATFAEMAK